MRYRVICSGMANNEMNEIEIDFDGIVSTMAYVAGFAHELLEYVAANEVDLEGFILDVQRIDDEAE